MRLPFPGENVYLLCKKCNHSFSGPCPNYGMPNILNLILKKNKCPNCGSTKIILHPAVRY